MNFSRLLAALVSLVVLSNVACGGSSGAPSGPTPTPTPTPTAAQPTAAITVSQTGGLQGGSLFTFSVETANFQAGGLNYRWDFGDGATSTDQAPAHTYLSAGQHTVVVTVSNAQQSARSEVSVDIYGLSGTWMSTGGTTTMRLTQTGRVVVGEASVATGPDDPAPYRGCAVTGSVEGPPAVILLNQPLCAHSRFAPLAPLAYRLGLVVGGAAISGTRSLPDGSRPGPITLHRQP